MQERCKTNINTMLFCNVVGTLHCNVVILGCGNVAGTSFSQCCENNLLTSIYVVCLLGGHHKSKGPRVLPQIQT